MSERTDDMEETVKRTEAKLKKQRARLQKARAAERAEERKAENHAKIVAGALLISHVPGGWKHLDMSKLSGWLNRRDHEIEGLVVADGEDAEWADANRRIRDWEKRRREAAKAEKKGAGKAPTDPAPQETGAGDEVSAEPPALW